MTGNAPVKHRARWELVRPVRPRPRPQGIWWARAGRLDERGYGGALCGNAAHAVYLGSRTSDAGTRSTFWLCAACTGIEEEQR